MKPFSLVGVDGNAFCIMGYTTSAMRKAGFSQYIKQYQEECTSGDYDQLLCLSIQWVDRCNEELGLLDNDLEE